MKRSVDLREILKAWPYDPENDARVVRGEDGREILQVRTPLGIEQYEMDGRPDGERPHGNESALDYFYRRLEQARQEGRENKFSLSSRECGELFNEGTLFYFRYVRLFQLKDWPRTIRDTTRNLRAFDFVHRYAKGGDDREFLERWRPYIMRVNASATAMLALDRGAYGKAVQALQTAIQKVGELEGDEDETFKVEQERSLAGLRELLNRIEKNRPLSDLEKLETRLKRAIERQEFELAATLRDRIRGMKASPAE